MGAEQLRKTYGRTPFMKPPSPKIDVSMMKLMILFAPTPPSKLSSTPLSNPTHSSHHDHHPQRTPDNNKRPSSSSSSSSTSSVPEDPRLSSHAIFEQATQKITPESLLDIFAYLSSGGSRTTPHFPSTIGSSPSLITSTVDQSASPALLPTNATFPPTKKRTLTQDYKEFLKTLGPSPPKKSLPSPKEKAALPSLSKPVPAAFPLKKRSFEEENSKGGKIIFTAPQHKTDQKKTPAQQLSLIHI